MNDKFVILHLSDAHIGKSVDGVDENNVFKPLLDDIAEVRKYENFTTNLIVFSGDLIQGCYPPCDKTYCVDGLENPNCKLNKQYAQAKRFIEEVTKSAGCNAFEVPLLIVPGNHDVNRYLVTETQKIARAGYEPSSVEKTQKDSNSQKEVMKRLDRWFKFAKGLPNHESVKWDDKFYVPYGTIATSSGKKIGFTGLNTSWTAHSDKEKHKLWIGKNQFDSLCQKIDGTNFKIAVSHHPCRWLHESESQDRERQIGEEFNLYFHGHEHSNWFLDLSNHLRVEGGAAYENSEKENAYSWLVIDFHENNGKIYARTYSNSGKRGWVPANVPGKIKDGIGEIKSLFIDEIISEKGLTQNQAANGDSVTGTLINAGVQVKSALPTSTIQLLEALDQNFKLRWEKQQYNKDSLNTQVFWPIRLRKPTAIHASQCFVAAALQKTGCSIHLFIDNFGKDHAVTDFTIKIKSWFSKVGGDPCALTVKNYDEFNTDDCLQTKRETFEKLLLQEIYTDTVLKISKIWHSGNDKESIVREIEKKRPRRLLAPAMTWTCLKKLCDSHTGDSIITLGGYDERILWETWRNYLGITGTNVGHLYVSELSGLHMADREFNWSGREDIQNEFHRVMRDKDALNFYTNMIPWCVNNCALLPRYITSADSLRINERIINKVGDLAGMDAKDNIDSLVGAVAEWVL